MKLLSAVSHINDLLRPPGFKPIHQSGEIGGSVVGSAIPLLDEGRNLLQLRNILEENYRRALAFTRDSFVSQFLYHALEARVVKTFPQRMIKFHAQALVNSLELLL